MKSTLASHISCMGLQNSRQIQLQLGPKLGAQQLGRGDSSDRKFPGIFFSLALSL
jgi:hypothetical protein